MTRFAPIAVSRLALTSVLAGCGYLFGDQGVFRDTSEDYKRAPLEPRLAVPEGKDDAALVDVYVIPEVVEEMLLTGEFEVPRPAPLVAGAGDEIVRIQRLGDQSWALMNLAPGQVWPQVRSFLAAAGLSLGRQDARAGVMETSWAQLEGAAMASRFRFRIEQGVQRGSSELHILQMNQAGDIGSWPQASDDIQQEQDMLQAVAQYLANSADAGSVSMIAEQGIDAAGRVAMRETPQGKPYIELKLPYDRAWASLGKALEESRFQINDRDRSQRRYYVEFLGLEEDDDGGWFDWLFDDEEHPLAGIPLIVDIAEAGESAVTISLNTEAGKALDRREEQNLLALLKGNIN